jgi:antitoxin HicB
MVLIYPAVLIPDDNGTVRVEFPDVPEANTFGDNEEEALSHARDALETALEFYIERDTDLPKPSPLHGRPGVTPAPLGALRLQLYQSMRDQKVNKAELARRLGWHYPQVVRLFDFEHASRVEQLEAGLAAVGRAVVVETAPSKTLAAVVGSTSMSRSEITRKIWAYIKRTELALRSAHTSRQSVSKLSMSRSFSASALTAKVGSRRLRQQTAVRKAGRKTQTKLRRDRRHPGE